MSSIPSHAWKFFRAGGFDQVRLDAGGDILNLDALDQKLWVALAAPTSGLEFDQKTLALIDTDKDGRIRAPEIIAAAKWACQHLKNAEDLLKSTPELSLSAINDSTPEGQQILASAKQILVNLGKKDANAITVEDTNDTVKIFAQTTFNGDSIVPADAASDEATKTMITEIISCVGAETDRSGKPGLNQAKLDQFFADAQAHSDWCKQAEADKNIMPLGDGTHAAVAAVKALKIKVEDYFARCRLVAFDERALNALNREEKEYLALAAKDLTITAAEIASFPLARVAAGKPLSLKDGVNPAWAGALATLQTAAVKPLLGDKTSITEADWTAMLAKLGPYECWLAGKVGASVEKLGLKRIREILGSKAKEDITALIVKDKALEPEANAIAAVDKLARYHRDLYKLLKNYVNFRDFYTRKDKAVFQVGTLYLDQRSCELCVRADDPGKHAALAGLAKTYLAYCNLTRKSTGEKMTIAAAFTDGGADYLMVGRNGIFYDRQGRDWDATITKIVDNPIGIRQAFWAPYKKFLRLIEEQVAKRAAAAESAAGAKLEKTAAAAAQPDKAKPGAEPKKMDVGTVAALGVGLGAIATVLGGLVTGLLKLTWWQWPLVIIGIILVISLPSVVIAWLKLRQRNLGPILDANGWAVNARAKINIPFGRTLTNISKLPPGAQRDLLDPYAEKRIPWKLYLFLVIVLGLALGWYLGKLDCVLPAKVRSVSVMGTNAPAYQPMPAMTNVSPSAAP
jgi:hypothetical protein